jgi:hypothetical protein
MMNIRNGVTAGLVLTILVVGLSACQKKEGPAERAGKAVDQAVDSAGQKLEKAGQDVQDAARDAKK